jgi:arginyl-tRNA synthetase
LFPLHGRLNEDLHIKFGRIEGISTRKGNVVFLKDVLDEAANRFKTSMMAKKSKYKKQTIFRNNISRTVILQLVKITV